MADWRYGISLLVFNSTSYSAAALTCEVSRWTLEEKFHISAHPCIILYDLWTKKSIPFNCPFACTPWWAWNNEIWIHIFLYDCLEKTVSLSDASRSPEMSLFILRLKDKISALTAFCCYWRPEKFWNLTSKERMYFLFNKLSWNWLEEFFHNTCGRET